MFKRRKQMVILETKDLKKQYGTGDTAVHALAAKPAIILADEPTGNLDSRTSQDVMGLLKTTSSKFSQTIVMITHNEEIAQLADRIIRIEDGRIVTQKTTLETTAYRKVGDVQ